MSFETLQQLDRLAVDLAASVRRLAELEEAAVNAEGAYKVARAKAFHQAAGSVQAREYEADIETETLRTAYRLAEVKVKVQREHLRALHTRIDVGRTLASSERTMSGSGLLP